ncbi:MAG: septum site-determining protein MinC [Azoarcus sp.]|jgi:septum site-determining protein MinC|nr:septum site-determining protein MinC [Azoarcus sp.]
MPNSPSIRPVEFHPTSLDAIRVFLNRADPAGLADDMHKLLGGRPDHFNHEAAILDFAALAELPERIDWSGLLSLLRRYRLQPVGVRNLCGEDHLAGARRAGLAVFDHTPETPEIPASRPPQPGAGAAKDAAEPPACAPRSPTLYIDRFVRSGQQVYAHGGDLVLLAGSSPGSEVIADGNIHCYGPLAGRALAGAHGEAGARIVATCFGPELVAVAGVYRTFERGVPEAIAGRAVIVRLKPSARNQTIIIEPIQID